MTTQSRFLPKHPMTREELYAFTAELPCHLIKATGERGVDPPRPYLERYLVASIDRPEMLVLPNGDHLKLDAGSKVYVHRFVSSDPDKGYHNHPWDSVSIPLVGQYTEKRWHPVKEITQVTKPGVVSRIGQDTFHRVKIDTVDVWTLFLRTGTKNGWGFLARYEGGIHIPGVSLDSVWSFEQAYDSTDAAAGWDSKPLGRDAGREPLYEEKAS